MNYFEDPPLSWHHLLEVLRDGVAHIDEHGVICHTNERLEASPVLPCRARSSIAPPCSLRVLSCRVRTPQSGIQSSQMAGSRHPFHSDQTAC